MQNMRVVKADMSMARDIANIGAKTISHPYSLEQIRSDIESGKYVYFVAKLKDTVIGYISLYPIFDSCDLIQIAVDPASQKQGVGKLLHDYAVHYLLDIGVNRIMLEVRRDNTAIDFYTKLKYRVISRREKYYGDVDALIMEKLLK